MVEIDKIIGRRIEKGRRRKGLLRHELGAVVGRSESWVGQVERGVAALRSLGEHVIDTRTLLKNTGSPA